MLAPPAAHQASRGTLRQGARTAAKMPSTINVM